MTDNLHILVLLREVCDPRPPVRLAAEGAAIRDRGVRRLANPADLCALEKALTLRDAVGGRVTIMALGAARLDDTLRLALSMGAERAIRLWDAGFAGADAAAEARVLARALHILQPDLFFAGHRLLDRGSDAAPALAAATLQRPYVTAAVDFALNGDALDILRKGDRGARQRVTTPLPCAVFFEDGSGDPRYPEQQALLSALEKPIEVWGLAELGLPFWEVGGSGALLAAAEYAFPRPNPLRLTTPDANLPAYERILSLLSGGIKPRAGKMHTLSAEQTADQLLRIFAAEGLL